MHSLKTAVQQVVQDIFNRDGEVKSSVLVQEASAPDSPAHPAFEWDDTKAGHQYRLNQARQWIRRVEIVYETRPQKMIHVPVIYSNGRETDGEGYYKPVVLVVENSSEFQRALLYMLAKLNSAQEAYEYLKVESGKADKIEKPDFRRADRGFEEIRAAVAM